MIKALRSEINQILRDEGIVTKVFDSQTIWRRFVDRLIDLVLEKPLGARSGEPSHVGELVLFAPDVKQLKEDYVRMHNLKDGVVFGHQAFARGSSLPGAFGLHRVRPRLRASLTADRFGTVVAGSGGTDPSPAPVEPRDDRRR